MPPVPVVPVSPLVRARRAGGVLAVAVCAALAAAAPQAAATPGPQPTFITDEQCRKAGGEARADPWAPAYAPDMRCEGGRYAELPVVRHTSDPLITPEECRAGGGALQGRLFRDGYRCDGGRQGGRLMLRPDGDRTPLTWQECLAGGGSPVSERHVMRWPPFRPYCSGGTYHGATFGRGSEFGSAVWWR